MAAQLIDVSREKSEKEKLANERGKLADENGKLAEGRLSILSITDQQLGHLLMEQCKDADALAYEARCTRIRTTNARSPIRCSSCTESRCRRQFFTTAQLRFYPSSVAFSADRTRMVAAGVALARMWDAATGKPLGEPMPHDASSTPPPSAPTARGW